jgi:hypothetical protein
MATRKQAQAAKRNVTKAQKAAAGQKTLAHLPADTKSALGKQGAAVAQRNSGVRIPLLRQAWRTVTFVHWRYPAASLQARLPDGSCDRVADGRRDSA